MLEFLIRDLRLRRRKGLDAPIFLVATITLAIMFVAVYFAAVSGWMDDLGGQFLSTVEGSAPGSSG